MYIRYRGALGIIILLVLQLVGNAAELQLADV